MGAIVRTVKLAAPDWRLTEDALRAVVTPKTRAILVNSPLNPIGRVFDRAELERLGECAARLQRGCDLRRGL